MSRELTPAEAVERSLIRRFRKELWTPFIVAVQRYALIPAGSAVGAALDGTAGSAVMIKLLQELQRHGNEPFTVRFFAASGADAERTAALAELLGIPLEEAPERSELLAVPVCMSDAAENVLAAMLHEGVLRGTLPRRVLPSGVTEICPLFCVERKSIDAWARYNGLDFAESKAPSPDQSEARELLERLHGETTDVERNVFASIHNVYPGQMPRWTWRGEAHGIGDK